MTWIKRKLAEFGFRVANTLGHLSDEVWFKADRLLMSTLKLPDFESPLASLFRQGGVVVFDEVERREAP